MCIYYLKKAGLNIYTAPVADIAEPVIPDHKADHKIEDAFVKRVREAIEKNISEPDFTIEQLCKLVFMSHSQLHRKLDALTGCSANRFIRVIRLNKAKEMLKNTDDSIGTIAFECGYSDPGYFARIFKQENGQTPLEWRIESRVGPAY